MSRNIVGVCIIISLLVVIAGCQNREPINEQQNKSSLKNNNAASLPITDSQRVMHRTFSIIIPPGWKEVEYNNALIYMPNDGELADPFSEKISMMADFVLENDTRTLSEITGSEIAKSKAVFPDLQIISQDEGSRLGNIDASKIVLSMRIQNRTLLTTQLRARHGIVINAFSIQCEQDKCRYMSVFDEMAHSFEWSNP